MRRFLPGYLIVLIAGITVSPTLVAAAPDRGSVLRKTLTSDEFSRAGLNKLTASELAVLEETLVARGLLPADAALGATAPVVQKPAAAAPTAQTRASDTTRDFGAEQVVKTAPANTPDELRSRIEGTVEELSGRSVFVLENGQVWQQRIPESAHFARKLVNPEVVITRGFGGYKMLLVPADRVVFVKRIK